MFEKGDCATESNDLLYFIDFDFLFNLIIFCDILRVFKLI